MKKKRSAALLTMVFLALLMSAGFAFRSPQEMAKNRGTTKYYTSVQVDSGDSLWTIANEYITPEYSDREAYIQEIKETNGLCTDRISQGTYLNIPYYAAEPQK